MGSPCACLGHNGLSGCERVTPMTVDEVADLAPGETAESGLDSMTFAGFWARSACTSDAGLSRRRPLYDAWRTCPSVVQPANSISATSSGFTQCRSERARGAPGP